MDHHITISPKAFLHDFDFKQFHAAMLRRDHKLALDDNDEMIKYYDNVLNKEIRMAIIAKMVSIGRLIQEYNFNKSINSEEDLIIFCKSTQDKFCVSSVSERSVYNLLISDIIDENGLLYETKCRTRHYKKNDSADNLLKTMQHLIERKKHGIVQYKDRYMEKCIPFIEMIRESAKKSSSILELYPGKSYYELQKRYSDDKVIKLLNKDSHDRMLLGSDFEFLLGNGMDTVRFNVRNGKLEKGCIFRAENSISLNRKSKERPAKVTEAWTL